MKFLVPPPRILEPEAMLSLEEVRAYDGLARKYLKILHYGFLETIINSSPEEGLFLDVGTGTGLLAIELARLCPKIFIIAVDLSDNMLLVAEENAKRAGVFKRIIFLKADAKNLPFKEKIFDCIFCHNMLHHVPEPEPLLREINRVAKDDAAILIRDLVRLSSWERFLHVNIFGFHYNKLMKKEYENSIKAAFSKQEWLRLAKIIPGAQVTYQFLTHQSIERPSKRKRKKYFKIAVPFYIRPATKFYISKINNPANNNKKNPYFVFSQSFPNFWKSSKNLLKSAIWAPSGDNLQPWRFKISAPDKIEFFYDPAVDDSFFNFNQVATLIALGAAFENVSYLLRQKKIEHDFNFEFSSYRNLKKAGVLRVEKALNGFRLSPESAVFKRVTNRKFYEKVHLSISDLREITSPCNDPPVEIKFLRGKDLEELSEFIYLADLIRVERRDLHKFLISTIRWSKEEAEYKSDGMPLETLEAGKAGEYILRLTRPWPIMKALSKVGLAKAMALHTKRLALSAEGIFAFCHPEVNEKAFFETGQALERIWLLLAEKGLAAQPLAAAPLFLLRWRAGRYFDFSPRHQILMREIEQGFEKLGLKNCLMLLRFGKAPPPKVRTPRKDIEMFLVS